jgi:hypothetical protein
MSRRDSGYERKPNELYETPPCVTESLVPHLLKLRTSWGYAWEPACASGKIVRVLRSKMPFKEVLCSDIDPHMRGAVKADFLGSHPFLAVKRRITAIISNPPYLEACQFIETALKYMEPTQGIVAMLLSSDYDYAVTRRHLFDEHPAFAMRVALHKRINIGAEHFLEWHFAPQHTNYFSARASRLPGVSPGSTQLQ